MEAKKFREHIDRTAQLIHLKAKEADLLQSIEDERATSTKKKGKPVIAGLQQELEGVRKQLQELESTTTVAMDVSTNQPLTEAFTVDLEELVRSNYQNLIVRVSGAMKAVLAEKAAKLDLKDKEGRDAAAWAEGVFLATHPARPKPSSIALLKSLMGRSAAP